VGDTFGDPKLCRHLLVIIANRQAEFNIIQVPLDQGPIIPNTVFTILHIFLSQICVFFTDL
jgi:hypothetical protein